MQIGRASPDGFGSPTNFLIRKMYGYPSVENLLNLSAKMSKNSWSAFVITLAAKMHGPFDLWILRFRQISAISGPEIISVPGVRPNVGGSFRISGSHGPADAAINEALAFS